MDKEKVSIIQSYILFWKNAFDFKSRTRRRDYWSVAIINWVIMVLCVLFNYVGSDFIKQFTMIFLIIFRVLTFIPVVAIMVRRLHDVGKSGYYALVSLIPIVGQIILIVYMIQDSQHEANQFGESPKYYRSNTVNESGTQSLCCPICKSPIDHDDSTCPRCGSKINLEEIYG